MPQNAIPKRQNIASAAVQAASQLLAAARTLAECSAEQAAMGSDGNFLDSDFTNTSNPYLSAYNIGNLLSNVVPNVTAMVNGYVSGSSGATNAQVIRLCLPSPPN